MDIIQKIKEELQVEKWQVEAAVKLIDEGNTIPFISRYRKEVTGSLNDEQLRNLDERLTYLRSLEDKKEQVLKSIEEQGKLTDELKEKILAAKRAGIKEIIMSAENKKNIDEIQEIYLKGLTFHYVNDIREVFAIALTNEKVADPIDLSVKKPSQE